MPTSCNWGCATKVFTEDELKKYDGTDEKLPLYLVVCGEVSFYSSASQRVLRSKEVGFR